ncbi:MAG: MATE family efflux transporter [Clostridia bacterium]|nr:MATE family efflux transporter [Clostridia bacterium]
MKAKNTAYWSRIIGIALPIVINNLISQLQMLIDKIFLGRLTLECMSAVGNASGPIWTTMSTIFSMTLGGTILISQAIGANDQKRARDIMASVFKYNNILSLFWFVFWILGARSVFRMMGVDDSVIDMSVNYARFLAPIFFITGINASVSSMLQVSEKTKILAIYGIVRSGANIVLDYLLIFGKFGLPRMEVSGAALATTLADYIGGVVILIYIVCAKNLIVKPKLFEIIKAKGSNYIGAVKVGIPAALEEFAWNFGNLFLIVMLNRVSAVAAGIYAIIFSVELLPVVIFNGLGQATLTLSGQEDGRGNRKDVRKLVSISFIWSIMIAALILICFIAFPSTIMNMFTTDQSVITASTIYLIIVGIDLFPKSANIIIGSGIRGFGDTMWMLKTQIFGTFFVITASAIMVVVLHMGMLEIFWLVVVDETLRSLLNLWKLRKETKASQCSEKLQLNES